MPLPIRTVTDADIPAILQLLTEAFGPNPATEARYRTYVSLEPSGWVAVPDGDSLLGVGGIQCFGTCAFLGLMAVSPRAQRMGLGARILDELLRRAEAKGCTLVVLDSTSAGEVLYERGGFQECGLTYSFAVPLRAPSNEHDGGLRVLPIDLGDEAQLSEVTAFDAKHFGADRSPLARAFLMECPERSFLARDPSGKLLGYAAGQTRAVGPCIAENRHVARALSLKVLSLPFPGPATWVVPGGNAEALALVRELGGVEQVAVRHLRRGDPAGLGSDWSNVFAKINRAVG